MFAEERQKKIIANLNQHGRVNVKESSAEFGVTEDCIRKDLALLEKAGILRRVYGGAITGSVNPHDLDVVQRKNKNVADKRDIAQKALKIIRKNSVIYLDISTSNLELAKLLVQANMNVTVVTNMIDILTVLCTDCSVKVIFIGGTLNQGKDGFVGELSSSLISNFKIDLAFLGVVGVNVYDNAVATYEIDDGMTKKKILEVSKLNYMMCETAKFHMDGNFNYAQLDQFSGIIMEKKPNDDIYKRLVRFGLEIIC